MDKWLKMMGAISLLIPLLSCTKPTPDEIFVTELQGRVERLAKEQEALSKAILETEEVGARNALRQKKASLESRIERLKAKIAMKEKNWGEAPAERSPASSH